MFESQSSWESEQDLKKKGLDWKVKRIHLIHTHKIAIERVRITTIIILSNWACLDYIVKIEMI